MRKINNVSIMESAMGVLLSFTMTELAADGTIIKSGIRKSKLLKETDTEYNANVIVIKGKLELEEN